MIEGCIWKDFVWGTPGSTPEAILHLQVQLWAVVHIHAVAFELRHLHVASHGQQLELLVAILFELVLRRGWQT